MSLGAVLEGARGWRGVGSVSARPYSPVRQAHPTPRTEVRRCPRCRLREPPAARPELAPWAKIGPLSFVAGQARH